jgi:hypothetical protein
MTGSSAGRQDSSYAASDVAELVFLLLHGTAVQMLGTAPFDAQNSGTKVKAGRVLKVFAWRASDPYRTPASSNGAHKLPKRLPALACYLPNPSAVRCASHSSGRSIDSSFVRVSPLGGVSVRSRCWMSGARSARRTSLRWCGVVGPASAMGRLCRRDPHRRSLKMSSTELNSSQVLGLSINHGRHGPSQRAYGVSGKRKTNSRVVCLPKSGPGDVLGLASTEELRNRTEETDGRGDHWAPA